MSAFDKVIGYGAIKEELTQLADMFHNESVYSRLGAKMPKGLLLYGEPGVGKSLMAQSLIEELGCNCYTIRRNKADVDFINELKQVFSKAAENTPSVVLLDDLDKFAVDDGSNEEFSVIQSCIDEVLDKQVIIIATSNDIYNMPDSLLRAGRFDRKIRVNTPTDDDARRIIEHYMKSKDFVDSTDLNDVTAMLFGSSCAELETTLNEAAVYAGYERCDKIGIKHIVRAVLRNTFENENEFALLSAEEMEEIAVHEAGHIVVCEVLKPCCIGFASISGSADAEYGGCVKRCMRLTRDEMILANLGGKAAVEMTFGCAASGAETDLERAIQEIQCLVRESGICGIGVLSTEYKPSLMSSSLCSQQEAVVHSELEKYLFQVRSTIAENRKLVKAISHKLLEKKTLLFSDIQQIKKSCA